MYIGKIQKTFDFEQSKDLYHSPPPCKGSNSHDKLPRVVIYELFPLKGNIHFISLRSRNNRKYILNESENATHKYTSSRLPLISFFF